MLRALAIAACLGSALAPGHGRAQAPAEHVVLQRTASALARGQRERALRGLVHAIQRAPSPALLERYAELALPMQLPASARERAKLPQAAARLLGWLEPDPRPALEAAPRLSIYAAWALALGGAFEASRALLESEGARDPALTLQCLRGMAAWALLSGAPEAAEQALSLSRGFAPTDLDLAGELGLLLLARGAAQEALLPLAERFAAEPNTLSWRRDFAYALRAAGRPRESYELLRAEQAACAAAAPCLLELARTALEAGQPDAALAHAEQLLQSQPDALDALFLVAEAHGAAGRREAARGAYQRILRVAPDNLRARSALQALGQSTP